MAGNIYGYQGVHTPLESVTQGRYTLADYTSMRTELTSRLIALENQGGFVPTNVEITGYLHMLPGGAGMGEIETTSSITGESLYINSLAQCGNVECNNALNVGGNVTVGNLLTVGGNIIADNLLNVAGVVTCGDNVSIAGDLNSHDITVAGGYSISGDGSGLFNINDNTKLPLLGGTMVGPIGMNSNEISGISTARASLLTIGGQTNVLGQNTTAFNQSTNFTEYISYATSGSHRWFCNTAANAQVQSLSMTDTAITTPCSITASSFSGNGAALTGITATDASKLPLAGGTLTGNVQFATPACAINYKQNQFANWAIPSFISAQLNPSTHDVFRYTGGVNTTISLTNDTTSTFFYQDGMKQVTILKPVNGVGAYTILVLPPAGYVISSPGIDNAVNYLMDATASSVTFMVISAAKLGAVSGQLYVISKT